MLPSVWKLYHVEEPAQGYATFSDTLIDSFARESAYKAICPVCRGQGTRSGQCIFKVSRHIDHSELPPVLVVNAGLSNSESKAMWSSKDGGFLNSPTIDLDGVQYNIRVSGSMHPCWVN
jgi:hypothetical protein